MKWYGRTTKLQHANVTAMIALTSREKQVPSVVMGVNRPLFK